MQKYCEECSTRKHVERQKAWALAHHTPRVRKSDGIEAAALRAKRGAEVSATEALSMGNAYAPDPDLAWLCRVAVPFSYAASKNSIWGYGSKGHVYKRKEANSYRSALTTLIRQQITSSGVVVKQARLWIDIMVQKSDHRGDAVNVVDLVCDSIKDAIALDDRWYSIRRLDWQIIKHEPKLFVGIGQEQTEDLQPCSTCGRLLTFDHFGRNKSKQTGISRVCLECRRTTESKVRSL